jgi:hypothetical protein
MVVMVEWREMIGREIDASAYFCYSCDPIPVKPVGR